MNGFSWEPDCVRSRIPDDLPAKAKFDDLVAAAASARSGGIMVVTGGTGSGKTTLTPLALACAGYASVRVAMPGRAMVRSAVQALKAWRMDKDVGQQLRGESRGLHSRVVFATYGALLQQLLADGELHSEAVILDEFHCLGDSSDLQVLLAALLCKPASERPLVVLTSATMPDLAAMGFPDGLPTVHVSSAGRFEVKHIDHLNARTAEEAEQLAFDRAVAAQLWLKSKHGDTGNACAIVFLPSREACEKRADEAVSRGLPAFAAHADLPKEDWALEGGPNRIIFCTSVLEASVTIKTVEVVIDSGLTKGLAVDPGTGQTYLSLQKATEAQSLQRAGRAGRLCPGHYCRIVPADFCARTPLPLGYDERFYVQLAALEVGVDTLPAGAKPAAELAHSKTHGLESALAMRGGELLECGHRMLRLQTTSLEQRVLDAASEADLLRAGISLVAWSRQGYQVFRRLKDSDPRHTVVTEQRAKLIKQAGGSEPHLWLLLRSVSASRQAKASLCLSDRVLQQVLDDELELCELLRLPRAPGGDEGTALAIADKLVKALEPLATLYAASEGGGRRGGRWASVQKLQPSCLGRADVPALLRDSAGGRWMACLATSPIEVGWRLKYEMKLTWPVDPRPAEPQQPPAWESWVVDSLPAVPQQPVPQPPAWESWALNSQAPTEAAQPPLRPSEAPQQLSWPTEPQPPLLPSASWPAASSLTRGKVGQLWVCAQNTATRPTGEIGSTRCGTVMVGEVYRQVGEGHAFYGSSPDDGQRITYVAALMSPAGGGASNWATLVSLRESGLFRALWVGFPAEPQVKPGSQAWEPQENTQAGYHEEPQAETQAEPAEAQLQRQTLPELQPPWPVAADAQPRAVAPPRPTTQPQPPQPPPQQPPQQPPQVVLPGDLFRSPTSVTCMWQLDALGCYFELVEVGGLAGGGWHGFQSPPPSLFIRGAAKPPLYLKNSKRWAVSPW